MFKEGIGEINETWPDVSVVKISDPSPGDLLCLLTGRWMDRVFGPSIYTNRHLNPESENYELWLTMMWMLKVGLISYTCWLPGWTIRWKSTGFWSFLECMWHAWLTNQLVRVTLRMSAIGHQTSARFVAIQKSLLWLWDAFFLGIPWHPWIKTGI